MGSKKFRRNFMRQFFPFNRSFLKLVVLNFSNCHFVPSLIFRVCVYLLFAWLWASQYGILKTHGKTKTRRDRAACFGDGEERERENKCDLCLSTLKFHEKCVLCSKFNGFSNLHSWFYAYDEVTCQSTSVEEKNAKKDAMTACNAALSCICC